MTTKPKIQQDLEEAIFSSESETLALSEEAARLDVTSALLDILSEERLDQKTIARRLDKKESYVSKVLSGGHNATLKTIAGFFAVLGRQITIGHVNSADYFGVQKTCYAPTGTLRVGTWHKFVERDEGLSMKYEGSEKVIAKVHAGMVASAVEFEMWTSTEVTRMPLIRSVLVGERS